MQRRLKVLVSDEAANQVCRGGGVQEAFVQLRHTHSIPGANRPFLAEQLVGGEDQRPLAIIEPLTSASWRDTQQKIENAEAAGNVGFQPFTGEAQIGLAGKALFERCSPTPKRDRKS